MTRFRQRLFSAAATTFVACLAVSLTGCGAGSAKSNGGVTVGYTNSPLLSHLYAYVDETTVEVRPNLARFGSSADVGYALLAGRVDAGFMEPSKVLALRSMPGFESLRVAGKVSFPYGATLVVRKGLDLRLDELAGRRIAASSPLCELLEAFKADALRLGADISTIQFVFLPFDAMIPALEAGTLDGAILKGSYSAVAQGLGHPVLYQNWDLEAGDVCCPPVIAQLESLLVVRESSEGARELAKRLLAAGPYTPDVLRKAAAVRTRVPLAVLEGLPLPEYGGADSALLALFGEHDHPEENT